MAQLPPAIEQVLRVHAAFIHTVVDALRDRSQIAGLMNQLKSAEEAGWARLTMALRHIIEGRRDPSIFLGLDEEDQIIVDAVLRGIDNPATLPALDSQPDGSSAAPGLASLIDASARGDDGSVDGRSIQNDRGDVRWRGRTHGASSIMVRMFVQRAASNTVGTSSPIPCAISGRPSTLLPSNIRHDVANGR